jgi:serine/threonine-protein kinase RsbW
LSNVRRGFAREIESLGEIFRFLGDFAEDNGVDDRTALCINLVAEELFTNMVRHNRGGGSEIVIGLDRSDGRLRLELIDTDVDDFDPDSVSPVPVEAGIAERQPGGLGIHLVRSLVDDLHYDYRTDDRRMRISAVKTLEHKNV